MALITKFEKREVTRSSIHKTGVVAKYFVMERDGHKVIQINTYGSDDREFPGKLSQTLQIGKHEAAALVDILKSEFNL